MTYTNGDLARDYASYAVTEQMLRWIADGKMTLPLNELLVVYVHGKKAIDSIRKEADSIDRTVLGSPAFEGNLESLASRIVVGTKSK